MGTINYRTSDFITMGIKPYDIDSLLSDADFLEYANECRWTDSVEEYAQEEIQEYYKCDYENAMSELKKYSFWYFHVALKPGYYEGYYLDIENNFPVVYDSEEDKQDAQKEVGQLEKFLDDIAGLGYVSCSPGWCTKYKDYNDTLSDIKTAIEEIHNTVNTTPTWDEYEEG